MAEPSYYAEGTTQRRNDTRLRIWTKILGTYQNQVGALAENNPRRSDTIRTIKRKVLNAIANSGSWGAVSEPSGWPWSLPFTVQQNGNSFRVDPEFDLQEHAAIPVTTTYYVDGSTGNNGNSGLNWGAALLTLAAALGKADVDRVYVRNLYSYKNQTVLSPARSVEIIGDGTALITSDNGNRLGAWSLVGNHYESTVSGGEFVARVVDERTLDAFGFPLNYTARASIALVDANPGSFFWSGGVLYLRTIDSTTPTGNTQIRYYDSLAFAPTVDNKTFYIKNVNFKGGIRIRNSTAAGGVKAYLEDCQVGGDMTVAGVEEIILLRAASNLKALGDGINYDARNGIITKAIEIDCEIYGGGSDSSSQPTTAHNACLVVCINGEYHHFTGQCIADVIASKRWCLGTQAYNSATGVGFHVSGAGGAQWLDSCISTNNATPIQNGAGTTTYIRNFTGAGTNDIAGSLTAY